MQVVPCHPFEPKLSASPIRGDRPYGYMAFQSAFRLCCLPRIYSEVIALGLILRRCELLKAHADNLVRRITDDLCKALIASQYPPSKETCRMPTPALSEGGTKALPVVSQDHFSQLRSVMSCNVLVDSRWMRPRHSELPGPRRPGPAQRSVGPDNLQPQGRRACPSPWRAGSHRLRRAQPGEKSLTRSSYRVVGPRVPAHNPIHPFDHTGALESTSRNMTYLGQQFRLLQVFFSLLEFKLGPLLTRDLFDESFIVESLAGGVGDPLATDRTPDETSPSFRLNRHTQSRIAPCSSSARPYRTRSSGSNHTSRATSSTEAMNSSGES